MDLKKCEFCEQEIDENLIRCPYCASSFTKNKPFSSIKKGLFVILTLWPGLGQLFGVFASIILLSDEENEVCKKFGETLLLISIILFIFWILLIWSTRQIMAL